MTDSPRKSLRSESWFNDLGDPEMTALYLERYLNYGLTLEELRSGKPIIGIAQTGSDLSPCNRSSAGDNPQAAQLSSCASSTSRRASLMPRPSARCGKAASMALRHRVSHCASLRSSACCTARKLSSMPPPK